MSAEMEREVSRWRDEAALYMRLWSRLLDLAGQMLITGDDAALRAHLDQYRSGWSDETPITPIS